MSKLQDFHDTAYLSSLDLLQKFLAEPKRDVNAVDEVLLSPVIFKQNWPRLQHLPLSVLTCYRPPLSVECYDVYALNFFKTTGPHFRDYFCFGFPFPYRHCDQYGNTPLAWAARNNNKDAVQALLAKGAKVNLACHGGLTPLHHAMRHSCHAVIDVLLGSSADVNAQDAIGNAPIYYSAVEGDPPGTEKLITAGANVNLANKNGVSPLMSAVWQNQQTIFDMVLNAGAAVDVADSKGYTALHYAAQMGYANFVQRLIAAGAPVAAQARDGKKPLDLVGGNDEIRGMLEQAMPAAESAAE